jgi:hypothetical protein
MGRARGLATLSDDAWIPFAAAEALFDGDETKARKLLLPALKLGEVRSRGVYLPDQKTWDDECLRNDFEPEYSGRPLVDLGVPAGLSGSTFG